MSILIVGAGATGGFFGTRLAQAGREVTFLVRPGRAARLRQRGLRVTGPGGATEVTQPRLVTAGELTGSAAVPADLVLVTVKADGLAAVTGEIGPAVGPDTAVVPVLNGIRHLDTLNRAFGPARVLGGVALISAHLDQEGDVSLSTESVTLRTGAQDRQRTPLVERAARLLSEAGFTFEVSGNIVADMWSKWAFIASVGAVNCLLGGTAGEIMAADGGERAARAVIDEALSVARAAGYPVPDPWVRQTVGLLTAAGSPFASSMYRDLRAGRPVEVEPILGDLTAVAREHDLPTPLLDAATVALRVYQEGITS
jgi:2-dehydropantoate 2-reductase